MCDACRRGFIGGLAATGLSAAAGGFPAAAWAQGDAAAGAARSPLPARGDLVIRGAYVLTMDPTLGDIADGAVHVRDGAIVAVGAAVEAPGAEVIDGRGMIVLPGLVETHWHMWNTLFRSFAGDEPAHGYFPTVARFGAQMTPDDMYQATRLAAAEALSAGMTTVHDWCHNVRSRDHAERDIEALRDTGIRARFSYGWSQGQDDGQTMRLDELQDLHGGWERRSNDGLIGLGMGWRGMFRAGPMPERVYRAEIEAARAMGLPVSVHIAARGDPPDQIAAHARAGLLGPDVQIVHAVWTSPDEIRMIRESGATISVATMSELRIGFGLPPLGGFLEAGIPCGVSVDTSALIGSSSLFGVLRTVRDGENGRTLNEFALSARRVLELGTIEGARSMGLDHVIGSLTPGKRADLIMVDTNALNMGEFIDPAHLLVGSALPENVDTVLVDGRVLKRGGRLTALDTRQVVSEARAAVRGIRQRVAWR